MSDSSSHRFTAASAVALAAQLIRAGFGSPSLRMVVTPGMRLPLASS